jgi:NAD-dependent SIR2 family protein deacetylase
MPGWLETIDKNQPRDLTRSKAGSTIRTSLSPEAARAVLGGEVSLEAVAKKIIGGKVRNVVVLCGAGISVAAGIPDFRGESAAKFREDRQKRGLGAGGPIFDLSSFAADPKPFYQNVRELFLPAHNGRIKPTAFHWLIRLLHEKGVLRRIYTQNVDTLEHAVGIPAEKIVEAHGSFRRAKCTGSKCGEMLPDSEMEERFWAAVARGEVPTCGKCGAALIPDVIFFGMALPRRFYETRTSDFKACDLLIVAGTTLIVYPFAGLVGDVSEATPRVLINAEPTGPWKKHAEQPSDGNYRDVSVIGDCDTGARAFAALLGWSSELDQFLHSK